MTLPTIPPSVLLTQHLFSLLQYPLGPITASSLGAFVAVATVLLAKESAITDSLREDEILPAYDFIIVGAGAAGSLLANRLSEGGRHSVLLLEAGTDPLLLNEIPLLAAHNTNHPSTDWMYNSTPQANAALNSPNRMVRLATGKSLGGSTNLNWMVYMRGNPRDYDNWSVLLNDSRWTYDNLLSYFKKTENYHGNFPSSYHGIGGNLEISKHKFEPLIREWVTAAEEFGIGSTDPNKRQTSTFFPTDLTMKDGRRFNAYHAFLKPAMNRRNLLILRNALVDKVRCSKAVGVTYSLQGRKLTTNALREVIVSAGALGTPRVLQRSGIGPEDLLRKHAIPVVANLPGVGQNLQDHVLTYFGPFILNSSVSVILDRDFNPNDALRYANEGDGAFSWNVISGMAFFNTSRAPRDWPNICLFFSPLGIHGNWAEDVSALGGFDLKLLKDYVRNYEGRDGVSVLMNVGRPESRGMVRIASKRPQDPPLIDMGYYTDEGGTDIRDATEGLEFVVKYFEKSQTWQKYEAHLIPRHLPGCEATELKSKQYLECFARHLTGTTWHYSGTAKMGNSSDPMAVVDEELRVRKVESLRVVDGSVVPIITNGNMQVPTFTVAERAAELILKDHEE